MKPPLLYACCIAGAYVIGATSDPAGLERDFWGIGREDVGVLTLEGVPSELCHSLERQGTPEQVFEDGYAAFDACKPYIAQWARV